MPINWDIISFSGDGTPCEIATSVVSHDEINPTVKDDAFQLKLPANTLVSDNVLATTYEATTISCVPTVTVASRSISVELGTL